MKIGVPKEIEAGEQRVATTPEIAERLIKMGFSVAIEAGAGARASFSDEAYRNAGAEVVADTKKLWTESEIILKVRAPQMHPALQIDEIDLMRPGGTLISFVWPAQNPKLLERLAQRQATVLAVDSVPRISRAQKLDALSSMANIAGYRAVIEAAHHFGRFLGGQITAAGKIPPANVFVIGAGVAGLAAIGIAGNLGAIVRANDTRPEVKEQVTSLGAEFVEVEYAEEGRGAGGYAKVMSEGFQKAQREMIARQVQKADIVITTALIPGKPAPKLITANMVQTMKPGSVIVDLAGEQGGNCELTTPGAVVTKHDVTIIGYTNYASRLPNQSSTLYATNLLHLIEELCPAKDGRLDVNMSDEVIRGATVIKEGAITWPPPQPQQKPVISAPQKPAAAIAAPASPQSIESTPKSSKRPMTLGAVMMMALGALAFYGLGQYAPASFMAHFTVFVLACFVGYMVIWNVTPALHTPLMSVTNAISSIIAIGALIQVSSSQPVVGILAGIALGLTAVNMAGGFYVTQRMLRMFRR